MNFTKLNTNIQNEQRRKRLSTHLASIHDVLSEHEKAALKKIYNGSSPMIGGKSTDIVDYDVLTDAGLIEGSKINPKLTNRGSYYVIHYLGE